MTKGGIKRETSLNTLLIFKRWSQSDTANEKEITSLRFSLEQ